MGSKTDTVDNNIIYFYFFFTGIICKYLQVNVDENFQNFFDSM